MRHELDYSEKTLRLRFQKDIPSTAVGLNTYPEMVQTYRTLIVLCRALDMNEEFQKRVVRSLHSHIEKSVGKPSALLELAGPARSRGGGGAPLRAARLSR